MLAFKGFLDVRFALMLSSLTCLTKAFPGESALNISESKNLTEKSKHEDLSIVIAKTFAENERTSNKSVNGEKEEVPHSEFELSDKDILSLSLEISTENVINSPSVTTLSPILTTEISVTSQPLQLKKATVIKADTVSTPVSSQPISSGSTTKPSSDYKKKIKPSFSSYIHELLDESSDGTVSPSRMKVEAYAAPYNDVTRYPYGQLPTFSEMELGKLRLNHWRVNQMLKGSVDVEAEKLGLPGTRKEILRGKYPYPFTGNKRSAGVSPEPSYLDDSAADSLSSLLTSADQDNESIEKVLPTPPSTVQTILNWFTHGQHEDDESSNADPRRFKELKAQQTILPVALDYRGDFMFW